MRSIPKLALCGGVVYFLGCASTGSSRRHGDSPEVIEEARQRVLDQTAKLDFDSREMVRTNAPRVLYVGAPFDGQYTYQWAISSNRFAELITYGLKGLEKGPVRIREAVVGDR